MPDGARKYHLEYHIVPHPEGITTKQLIDLGIEGGLTDAIIITSILHLVNGGISVAIVSRDGREDRGLTGGELFEAWALWAKHLSESKDLDEGRRVLCNSVWRTIRAVLLKAKEDDD